MKVRCVKIKVPGDERYFTVGKVYDVLEIDSDGHYWVVDDSGDDYFLVQDEAQEITCTCTCTCGGEK